MSYIRSKDAYAYWDGESLIIATDHVIKQDALNGQATRYMVTITKADFINMAREILKQTAPPWARTQVHINAVIREWKKGLTQP